MTAVTGGIPVAGARLRPSAGERARWALVDMRAMTWRYLTHWTRLPQGVVFSTIQPVMFVLLFRYVFGGAIHPPGVNYVNYLMPGIILQTAAFGSIGTAIGLAEDASSGMIDRFRSLPMAHSAVLVGRITADTVRNVFVVGLIIGVGYAVGFRFSNGAAAAIGVVALALLVGLSFGFISAAIGLSMKDVESVQSLGLIWMFPLTFASSAFVPVATMPGGLRWFAQHQPVTKFVDALRDLSLGSAVTGQSAWHDVWVSFVWIGLIAAVFGPVAVRAYRRAS
jgi:ABC-2 type transport system permease protein/oleandomycin transport system permease protein